MGTELWTMAELADRVADALSSGYGGQQSRRVSDVPDPRAIRYYTTLGLIDRPATMRGRTALYGDRHLWQLVAIKRLQADGRTLAEIQHQLAGATDATLRRLAAVPEKGFWRRVPAPAAGTTAVAAALRRDDVKPDSGAPDGVAPNGTDQLEAGVYQAVPLGGGIVVLIPHRGALADHDIAALRAAAGPLHDAVARLTRLARSSESASAGTPDAATRPKGKP